LRNAAFKEKINMSVQKKIDVEWKTNLQFKAKNPKGLSVDFDVPSTHGGDETALSPMENVLASLAACSSLNVLIILKKKRQKVTSYKIEATADKKTDSPPKVFTKVHLKHIVTGENINPNAVEKAIELSEEKYCSVAAMLKETVEITSSYKIIEA
jgi:putative redox protein